MVKPFIKDLKSFGSNTVRVQVPLSPESDNRINMRFFVFEQYKALRSSGVMRLELINRTAGPERKSGPALTGFIRKRQRTAMIYDEAPAAREFAGTGPGRFSKQNG